MVQKEKSKMEKIISLCKRRGFIFPSSEIYGGVGGVWDYGPLGSLLLNNIKNLWLEKFVFSQDNIFLIEGAVLMHPKVWEASGHLSHFADLLVECKNCHARFRADHMEQGKFVGEGKAREANQCPECGGKEFTPPRIFNLMFKTFLGPVEDKAHITYLRPETAQSMFTNFKNILNSQRAKLPFGIAQIGKCFRNEITTGDFTFRSREFTIAEIEFFVPPQEDEEWFEKWLERWEEFFLELGLRKENLRRYEHPKESLAHYSKRTVDIEYKFPFGWAELAGVANRTDFDLKSHSQNSGEDLSYFDEKTNSKYFPFVIEPTLGVERVALALLCDAFEEIKGGRKGEGGEDSKEVEILLKLNKRIAPVKVLVLPLVRNKKNLRDKSKEVYRILKPHFIAQYDETGSIGRRYRRGDEIGVPYAVTIDFDTLTREDVTVRDRDTMKQERVKIKELVSWLKEKLNE